MNYIKASYIKYIKNTNFSLFEIKYEICGSRETSNKNNQ